MGGGPSKLGPTPDDIARSTLLKPCEADSPSVIGTVELNKQVDFVAYRNSALLTANPGTLNAFAPPRFDLPSPISCYGYDHCYCPHLPRGAGWESALAAGFGALVDEAVQLVIAAIHASLASPPPPAIQPHVAAGVAVHRALEAGWEARANAALQPHGLSVRAFCWIFKHKGEALRIALQVYSSGPGAGASPPVQLGVSPSAAGPMGRGLPPPEGGVPALPAGNAVAPHPAA